MPDFSTIMDDIRKVFDNKIRRLMDIDNKIDTTAAGDRPCSNCAPDHATPVIAPNNETYMHVWLEDNPSRLVMRLRNGYIVKIDQRLTPALAIAMLKLPYKTDPPPTPTTSTEGPLP